MDCTLMEETAPPETLVPVAAPVRGDDSPVPRYFSLSQRIGRVRYLVYCISGAIGCSVLQLMIYLLCLALPPELARLIYGISQALISVALPLIVIIMVMRRLHDIDFKAWWAFLAVIPFLTLVLLFVPGSPGANRFGPAPRSNGAALKLAAILLPLLLFLLFFALRDIPTQREQAEAAAATRLKSYDQ